jgi:FAD/FMN-containing dehydrogenase
MELSAAVQAALRAKVRGTIILPDDEEYTAARRVWNAAVDRRPAGVVVCADAEDVAISVRIAAEHGLRLTVRGGGHNVAGRSIRDGVLLLDLSKLRTVTVNPEMRSAAVQGGALWRDVDEATAQHGLATTGGLVSSTGVGGLTLGGGAGWLMRKHGLACDNLLRAGVVLADGRFVRACAEEHPDLFWGLRGGAGGLGVVTSFEFQLHPLRDVMAGLIVHPAEHALQVLRAFRDFAADAPPEFCGLAVAAHAPPLPFLETAWHGRPAIILAVCWSGAVSAGESGLAPLRNVGRPVADHIGPMPYARWQQMQDPGAPAGRYYYWKTANYREMSESTLEQLAAAAQDLPTPLSEIHLQHMGAAVARVPTEATAFAHRDANFFVNVIGAADREAQVAPLRDRVRALHEGLSKDASPGILANFSDRDDIDESRWIGRPHAQTMDALRRRYDPAAMFTGA